MHQDQPASAGRKVMERVRIRRAALRMSAEKLAQTCTAQGYPMKRSTLANLETGRREDVSVGELIAFANALNTTAVKLLGEIECGHCKDNPPTGYLCRRCGKGE